MIEQDTIKLLRECDAGVEMGVLAIDDVLGKAHSDVLEQYLILISDRVSIIQGLWYNTLG